MTNRKQESLARRCEPIATFGCIWKVLMGQHFMALVICLVKLQFNNYFLDLCGSLSVQRLYFILFLWLGLSKSNSIFNEIWLVLTSGLNFGLLLLVPPTSFLIHQPACPDQADGKGKTDGPKASKTKDSAKVVELRSPILSGNLLILSYFDNITVRTYVHL